MIIASIRAAEDEFWRGRDELEMFIAGVRADYDKLRGIFIVVHAHWRAAGVRRVNFSLRSK